MNTYMPPYVTDLYKIRSWACLADKEHEDAAYGIYYTDLEEFESAEAIEEFKKEFDTDLTKMKPVPVNEWPPYIVEQALLADLDGKDILPKRTLTELIKAVSAADIPEKEKTAILVHALKNGSPY